MPTRESCVDAGFAAGMFQHRQEMLDFLGWLNGAPERVVEIGAHRGGTAVMFCELGSKLVISVDLPDGPWGGVGQAFAERRNTELAARYPAFKGILADSHDTKTVLEVVRLLDNNLVDLLFIDGDHSKLGASLDFTLYSPLVRPGGVVAFHDVNDTRFHRDRGVMVSAVWDELVGDKHVFTVNADWGGIGAMRTAC